MAEIRALVFDVDDTMYSVSSGFSHHRHNDVIVDYGFEKLGFATREEARAVKDDYFKRFHSTVKGFAVAHEEGALPKPFDETDFTDFWAENCQYEKYLKPDDVFIDALRSLRDDSGLSLIAFSNAPRKYMLKCLDALGVREFFPDAQAFAVEDVLPLCKPQKEAFAKVLAAVSATPEQAVMFEDSMKNIRACKALGMRTVLIDEGAETRTEQPALADSEAWMAGDVPMPQDPSVDVVLRNIREIRERLPELWKRSFPQSTAPGDKTDMACTPSAGETHPPTEAGAVASSA
eukprot:TRINITY_DN43361_c0_g1_i1.p1 TRINITY_DN43361_c0_g1~~TRINITY_DN43361_c0_g1_i1.p1  ORF type:complete len:331 (-),score=57.68 TRINITY_DN43361_c0_g1_i1:117-986(-)